MIIPEPLYRRITSVMPIPCVDLLVVDADDRVLLVRRRNPPAEGEWWFPGGRVHFGESRLGAAARKLREECGLEPMHLEEVGTYDLLFDLPDGTVGTHGITTLFRTCVPGHAPVVLDEQSSHAAWRPAPDWGRKTLHPFVRERLHTAVER